ncbi:hypothetical protein [Fusobacterium sp.]|nr:hypothetical protein [Fusobacterium sp.]MDU1912480.1 hypothetical protein [Fusobacterium sp.]
MNVFSVPIINVTEIVLAKLVRFRKSKNVLMNIIANEVVREKLK